MSPIDVEQTCAIIHGKLGNFIYRHYRLGYTQKVPAYVPTNPQTPSQMNWRFIFAEAIAAWKALPAAEKKEWNTRATKRSTRGTYLFRTYFLRDRPNVGSPARVGTTRIGGLDTVG